MVKKLSKRFKTHDSCSKGVQGMADSLIQRLFIEGDIPVIIFSYLSAKDVLNVELVCHAWRTIVMNYKLWETKLQTLYNVHPSWQNFLTELLWKRRFKCHASYKQVYMKISAHVGPSHISEQFGRSILNDSLYGIKHQFFNGLEEQLFLKNCANRKSLFNMTCLPRLPSFQTGCSFSALTLTGPKSFPIIVNNGNVIVAGATYGKGRIAVVGHETLMCWDGLIRYLTNWCGKGKDCQLVEDPISMKWSNHNHSWELYRKQVVPPRKQLNRKKLHSGIPVFLTEGHYDGDMEYLLKYIQQGGCVILGGHAWQWAFQAPGICHLLEHPGNRITAPMGIIFSTRSVVNHNVLMDVSGLPGLKHSLYYLLKCTNFQPSLKGFPSLTWARTEIETYYDILKDVEHFKDLLRYF